MREWPRGSGGLVLAGLCLALATGSCGGGGGSSDGGGGSGGGSDEPLVLPVIGEPPPGLTRDALENARAAAEKGLGYDFANDQLVSLPVAPSEVLIRPGVQIVPESIFPGWCTAAFVFDDRTRIATAGHCTESGDTALALAAPTIVFAMGVTSSSTGADSALGDDWALIDILPQWRPFVDPAVALVGGPCGRASGSFPPVVKYVGHGAAIGTGGTARLGVFAGEEDGAFVALGPTSPGDSGGPVLEASQTSADPLCAAGGALGILTHTEYLAVDGIPTAPTGFFFGTPISRIGNTLDDGALLP